MNPHVELLCMETVGTSDDKSKVPTAARSRGRGVSYECGQVCRYSSMVLSFGAGQRNCS